MTCGASSGRTRPSSAAWGVVLWVLGFILVAAGCSDGGMEYSIGDCIAVRTNNEGAVVPADDCTESGGLTVMDLARGGQVPDCGTGYSFEKDRVAVYVRDLVTDITYCGF